MLEKMSREQHRWPQALRELNTSLLCKRGMLLLPYRQSLLKKLCEWVYNYVQILGESYNAQTIA